MGPRQQVGDAGDGASERAAAASVILTCHNEGTRLCQCVESVLAQNLALELVIVDDGSSDPATLQCLEALEGRGVRVIHQANRGQTAATMTGLRATSAPYVMRFDADDVLAPGALARLVEALEREPGAAAAWGDVATFGGTTFIIPGIRGLDPWLVTYTNAVTGSGTLFRRTAVVEAGGWQLDEGWEDWDLWMAFAERQFAGLYVPMVIFKYRRSETGRLAGSLNEAEQHYAVLRSRHANLFARRRETRRQSRAPRSLQLAVAGIERVPKIPRLVRIQLAELCCRLMWGGGIRPTIAMVCQGLRMRLSRGHRH